MKQKAIQYFSDEQLAKSQAMTAEQRLRFLDNFRKLHAYKQSPGSPSKLISIKIPEDLLDNFKAHCNLQRVKYQTQIKQMIRDYLQ